MLKKLLQITLLTTTLFSYEIVIDKTSQAPKAKWGVTFTRDDVNEVVVNDKTGLMWQDDKSAKIVEKDWNGAKDYCQSLNFSGFNNWYLPTIKELETLIDIRKYNPAIKDGFKNVATSNYWSSSLSVSPSISSSDSDYDAAWYVDFYYGDSSYNDKTDERYVRCVRTGQ